MYGTVTCRCPKVPLLARSVREQARTVRGVTSTELTAGERRRWGASRHVYDDGEARGLLLDALQRCLVRQGSVDFAMGDVAAEAGVTRSTLYRYFPNRRDLLSALVVRRLDAALGRLLAEAPDTADPARCVPDLVLALLALTDRDPVNESLFAGESQSYIADVGLATEAIVDVEVVHLGPLLEGWRASGAVHGDLDVRETVRWLNAMMLVLQTPALRERDEAEKRLWLDRFVVRTLVP